MPERAESAAAHCLPRTNISCSRNVLFNTSIYLLQNWVINDVTSWVAKKMLGGQVQGTKQITFARSIVNNEIKE